MCCAGLSGSKRPAGETSGTAKIFIGNDFNALAVLNFKRIALVDNRQADMFFELRILAELAETRNRVLRFFLAACTAGIRASAHSSYST